WRPGVLSRSQLFALAWTGIASCAGLARRAYPRNWCWINCAIPCQGTEMGLATSIGKLAKLDGSVVCCFAICANPPAALYGNPMTQVHRSSAVEWSCPYCKEHIHSESEAIRWFGCAAPHHISCWNEHGNCCCVFQCFGNETLPLKDQKQGKFTAWFI